MPTMLLTLLIHAAGSTSPGRVVELRSYLLKEGATDSFIDYFERHFIFSQEREGMRVLGQFRVVGEPDRFVWIRGFADMGARRTALEGFYTGPVWKELGPQANEMMLEWHNVHLLKPVVDATALRDIPSSREMESSAGDGGLVAVDFFHARNGTGLTLAERFESDVRPAMRRRGIPVLGLFISEMAENDFSRLPVIQDERVLVVLSSYADEDELRRTRAGLFDGWTGASTETMVLRPTERSPIRHRPR